MTTIVVLVGVCGSGKWVMVIVIDLIMHTVISSWTMI